MYRVEDKYYCSEQHQIMLQKRIGSILQTDDNQKDDSGYTISSVYFDDLYDTCLRDTQEGNPEREKYRIRIYNDSLETIKLEVKYKKYNRILKKSATISRELMEKLLKGEWIDTDGYSSEHPLMLFKIAMAERGLRPKIIVTYERQVYVFKPGNVRITFDRDIRESHEIDKFGQKNIQWQYVSEMGRILEVKYDEFLPDFIAQLLETGNMQQTSCSKYRLCRERDIITRR